jgi:hypothetical protein
MHDTLTCDKVTLASLQGHVVEVPMNLAPPSIQQATRGPAKTVPALVADVLAGGTLVLQFFGYAEPQDFGPVALSSITVCAPDKGLNYYPQRANRPAREVQEWGSVSGFDEFDQWGFYLPKR